MTDADLDALVAAKEQYERRAMVLFELEDDVRSIGAVTLAGELHREAIIAGHAAWAELVDPEPR